MAITGINDKFNEIISNLLNSLEQIQAVAIVDKDGLIIYSKIRDISNEDDEKIGTVTAMFDSFIERIKKDFRTATNFVNITLVDEKKFLFATAGSEAILTIIADETTSDNNLKVFGRHVANKVKLILEGEEIDYNIPPIIQFLSNMREGKIPVGNFSVKVIVLGAPGVGKTSLIRRFVDDKFAESYVSTIGVDISRKEVKINDDCVINESLWDIGGQSQEMAPHRKRFYQGANFAFLVFDITQKDTFERINTWEKDLETSINRHLSVILIANKTDLENQEVTLEEIKQKASSLNCPYLFCSAKSGSNVNDAFRYAAYKFLEQY